MEEIRYLFKNAKYILPFLTALSLTNLEIFYSSFGIEIGSYLTFEEFITPFIDDMLIYGLGIFSLYFFILIFFPPKLKRANLQRSMAHENLPYLSRLKEDFKRDGYWLSLMLLIFAILILKAFMTLNYSLLSLPLTFAILHIRREILIKHPNLLNTAIEFVNLSIIMSSLMIFTFSSTLSKVYRIKNGNSKKIVIAYNNITIMCPDSLSYIGRIKSHTFLYNPKLKSTSALDNENITMATTLIK